jgi:hypothetical protein
MTTKVDQLIEKFKELKEELNKNVNCAPGTMPNGTTGTSGGEGGMYRSEEAKKNGDPMLDAMAMSEVTWCKCDKEKGDNPKCPMHKPLKKSEKMKMSKNGQWSLDKVDPQENVNIPHPQGKAKMANGVNKDEGTNRKVADPEVEADPRGHVHMVKEDKVMPMASEKESKKANVSGLPYSGKDKEVHKGEQQGNNAKGFDENKAPGRHAGFGY